MCLPRTAGSMSAGETLNLVAGNAAEIPSVDRLLNAPGFAPLLAQYGRAQVTAALRAHLEALRRAALAGELDGASLGTQQIAAAVVAQLAQAAHPALRPVFNLTGTVLHTNLGRALLSQEAVHAVVEAL